MTLHPAYVERMSRFEDAVACREKGRVVVAPQILYLPIFLYGKTTVQAVMEDYTNAYESWINYHHEYQPDLAWGVQSIFSSSFLSILGCNFVKWPGRHFENPNMGFQVIDAEYMSQEEYVPFAEDPTGFILRKILPRHYKNLNGLRNIDLSNLLYMDSMNEVMNFASQQVQDSMETLFSASQIAVSATKANTLLMDELAQQGWPAASEYVVQAPYDMFSDTLRGLLNTSMDMYDCPDELLLAIEAAQRLQVGQILAHMRKNPTRCVYFYLHSGMDEFMSTEQFERFYWPGLKACIQAVNRMGGVSKIYTQGNMEKKLDILRDVPQGSAIYYFTGTNLKKAKQKLGGHVCIAGGVDGVLLLQGTPKQVVWDVREVLDTCMPGGGYLLDTTVQLDNARPENLHALFDTAFKYGVY